MPGSTDDPNVVYVDVGVEALGDLRVGLWCDSCALPAAASESFVLTLDGRPSTAFVMWACADCGESTIHKPPLG